MQCCVIIVRQSHLLQSLPQLGVLVYNATMISQNQGFRGLVDRHNPQLRAMLRNVPAAARDTNQPEVFRYGLYRGQEAHEVLSRLLFYGGVDIYAFGAAPVD